MYIGSKLRKLRDQRRISTREIADKAGIAQSTYLDWEQDKTSPRLKNFAKLAEAFQLSPKELMDYLLDGKGEETLRS
ncbi:hypothetical protein GCM10027275_32530 [Rhabdobacter roseus]|uniref:Transcriptional regulator with XRE-family HTH domain n=1 Tax=Rhabdobacter roseus TaxID=1655419 RepID=A0A840TRH7_9BACT|nr:helix-turn-helix transcriptional regulator [Rhabdobacter roseus]MBB5285525.1 transcriptional regulator with XRE-family HTH domain [Rhabdobacter roseus]